MITKQERGSTSRIPHILQLSGSLVAALIIVAPLFVGGVSGCGGGGGSSDSGSGTGTTAGTASVSNLSSVPSVDVSNLDYTTTASTAAKLEVADSDQSGLVMKSAEQGLGRNFNAVGSSSRAGCEQDKHKREIKRHSKQVVLPKCFADAMEKAKLITIPADGVYAYYQIKPPEASNEDFKKACDKIPADHKMEIEQCKKGGEGPRDGGMKMRIKKTTSGDTKGLEMDMCEGKDAKSVTQELTYSAKGSLYTASAVRSGSFGGGPEKSAFNATIDLGTTGKVTDGIPDLGDGAAEADASMEGKFGSGRMKFKATGKTKAVAISGFFAGGFKEQRSGSSFRSDFVGEAYAEADSSTGCAKFRFAGTIPPMPLKDMIPFNIGGEAQLDAFLQNFGLQLGISLTKANYLTTVLCPNPNFDPQKPDADKTIKPMVAATATGCGKVTHEGVECFSVTNGTKKGQFGDQKTQVFTIIANSGSAYFTSVNAFKLDALDKKKDIKFERNWDCTAETGKSISDLDFAKADKSVIDTELKKCFKIEEEALGDNGMGGYNCHEQQNQGDMNKFADNGPPPQGVYAGQCQRTATPITCSAGSYTGRNIYFFNTMDKDKGEYCLVSQGSCPKFTATSNNATITIPLADPDGSKVTAIAFTQSGTTAATAAVITLTVTGAGGTATCTANCTMSAPASFATPPKFEGGATPGGPPPVGAGDKKAGETGFVPKSCIDAGLTTAEACRAHCMSSHDCAPRI